MFYGIYTPNFGAETTPRLLADLAAEAEEAGWDGFFLWDHIVYSRNQKLPLYDPWVTLAGIAMRTKRLRFGTTVTPIARRRPWKLARETVTLDHLSGGQADPQRWGWVTPMKMIMALSESLPTAKYVLPCWMKVWKS